MLDSIQVKKRLAKRGFTDEQAEGLAEEIATLTETRLVTKKDLRKELGWWAFGLLVGNGTITAALLALYGVAG